MPVSVRHLLAAMVVTIAMISMGCAAAVNPVATAAPSSPPTPTLAPAGWPGVMGVYPLAQGAAWTYHVTVDYAGSNGSPQQWKGEITETVISATPAIENWVFHMALTGDTSHTWRPVDQYYTARGGGLFKFSDEKSALDATNPQSMEQLNSQILAWPLQDGQRWGPPDLIANESQKQVWFVTAVEGIDVPAGRYENCFRIEMLTDPDDVHYLFCPGVGFVRYEYRHHGTLQNEVWNLVSFTPGS